MTTAKSPHTLREMYRGYFIYENTVVCTKKYFTRQ